jgi:hypothetical protein
MRIIVQLDDLFATQTARQKVKHIQKAKHEEKRPANRCITRLVKNNVKRRMSKRDLPIVAQEDHVFAIRHTPARHCNKHASEYKVSIRPDTLGYVSIHSRCDSIT